MVAEATSYRDSGMVGMIVRGGGGKDTAASWRMYDGALIDRRQNLSRHDKCEIDWIGVST